MLSHSATETSLMQEPRFAISLAGAHLSTNQVCNDV